MKNHNFLKKPKTLVSLLAIGALLAMMVAPAFAAPIQIAYTSGGTPDTTDGTSSGQHWLAQTFNVSTSYIATEIDVYLYRETAGGNHYHLYVYQWNDTTSEIVGSALGFGEVEYGTGLGSAYLYTNFTLTPQPTLEANTMYAYVIDDTLASFVFRRYGALSENGGTGWKNFRSIDADLVGWTDVATNDMGFIVWGTTVFPGSGGDAPGGTWTGGSWDILIEDFTQFMVPLLVVLLPFALLALITKRVDKWILLIGITIGVALGFYFGLVPLWLVFLVTIGLVGMAYQSVRGGG